MFARKTKQPSTPPADPAEAEFEAAKARWSEITAADRARRERLTAMRLAMNLAAVKPAERDSMPKQLQDQAQPYRKLAQKRPAKMADEAAELEQEIEKAFPIVAAEREAWEAAQRRYTNAVAITLQSRHREAVRAIADALEALSRAVAAEAEIHEELRRRAPLPDSPNLPSLGREFSDVCVSQWGSRAWEWARRVAKLEILKNA